MEELVTIRDYGQPEYLDGASMQYAIYLGDYSSGECVAFCMTFDIARALANALGQTVVINKS